MNKQSYNYSQPPDDTCGLEYDEDVLYLTVFMPNEKWRDKDYAVIVWLHEHSTYHSPDFLIDEDVIVVTISFRTSIFGFLNTEDCFARGNMGAKDILLGLKWIRENIVYFNGDPNKVTVIGSGAASDVVASFLLSPLAEDLFSRVVIQSGSALNPVVFNSYNLRILHKLYWSLCGWAEKFDRTRLYELLLNASGKKLAVLSQDLFDSTEVRNDQRMINSFGPTVELLKKGAFMDAVPPKMYEEGRINNNVEVLMGFASLESLYKLEGFVNNRKLLKYINYNFQYLLPFEGRKDEYGSKQYKKIRRKIMDFYFVNGTIRERSLRRYGKYLSDQVIYPVLRQARLHAQTSRNHVYLYRFSFKGSLNIVWNSVLDNLKLSGATAGDEICYQFRCKSSSGYNSAEASDERHFIKKIARLLANFAKYG